MGGISLADPSPVGAAGLGEANEKGTRRGGWPRLPQDAISSGLWPHSPFIPGFYFGCRSKQERPCP